MLKYFPRNFSRSVRIGSGNFLFQPLFLTESSSDQIHSGNLVAINCRRVAVIGEMICNHHRRENAIARPRFAVNLLYAQWRVSKATIFLLQPIIHTLEMIVLANCGSRALQLLRH